MTGNKKPSVRRSHRSLAAAVAIIAVAGTFTIAGPNDKPKKPKKHPDDALVAKDPSRGAVGAAVTTATQPSAPTTGAGLDTTPSSTLVLYDSTGPYGWLGQLYGLMAVNLVRHFGSWAARPVMPDAG